MSSFICSSRHFNSIEAAALRVLRESRYNTFDLKAVGLYKYDVTPKDTINVLTGLISSLRDINVLCASLQSRKHFEGKLDFIIEAGLIEVRHGKQMVNLSDLGLLNALNCLDYQIELEHLTEIRTLTVEELRAIEFLKLFRNSLALFICGNLPEDKTNKWSI
jgi:hypothetical protein|tara:strand:+ start:5156 stop:5641 length:486 start_codon:yes stop_codon:yes gene_type:complete